MDQNPPSGIELSLKESNFLKGIALILLLIHHLFYQNNGMFDDIPIGRYHLVNMIGLACKVCVAIFVFLSGYACAKTTQFGSWGDVFHFYGRRLKKLFLNYWFIWLIFVPAGIFIFGRSFDDVYAEPKILNFLLDFFGLINLTGKLGYNPTWWFYSCILTLYLIFPLMWMIVVKWPRVVFVLLAASVAVFFFHTPKWFSPAKYYLLPFTLGMALSVSCVNSCVTAIYKMGGVIL